jgi:hypothetical protein
VLHFHRLDHDEHGARADFVTKGRGDLDDRPLGGGGDSDESSRHLYRYDSPRLGDKPAGRQHEIRGYNRGKKLGEMIVYIRHRQPAAGERFVGEHR